VHSHASCAGAQALTTEIPTQSCSHHVGKCHSGRSQELLWLAEGPCRSRAITALREGLQASMSSCRPQPGRGQLTRQPSPTHPSLENFTILQCSNSIFKKFDPCSYSVRRSRTAVPPHLKELLCTGYRSKSSAVPMITWFSKSCSS